jgi:hypothetical protein
MTREEIIRLAEQAENGKVRDPLNTHMFFIDELERFVALVAAAERKACIDDVLAYGGIHIYDASKIVETIRERGNT